ncbi:unnamed protein product, partial [Polarella glacialis]
ETPTNLAELQRQLRAWKGAAEAAGEDRKVFQQFVELVFPGQDAALQLFNRPALGSDAFDVLLQRWMVLEDLQNQSIASINVMAREQVLAHSQEFQAAINSRQDSERRTQDLQDQLTKMAREKAQMLTQRLHGGGGQGTGSAEAPSVASSSSAADQAELRELREQRAAADRRERESREVAERHEQVLQASIDEQRAKVRRLKRELDRLSDESEHRDTQANKVRSGSSPETCLRKLHEFGSRLIKQLRSLCYAIATEDSDSAETKKLAANLVEKRKVQRMNSLAPLLSAASLVFLVIRLLRHARKGAVMDEDILEGNPFLPLQQYLLLVGTAVGLFPHRFGLRTHYTACVMMDVIACMGVSSAYKDRNFLRYHVLNETLLIIRISQASIVGCFPLQLGLNLACSTFNAVLSKQLASDSDTYAASPT